MKLIPLTKGLFAQVDDEDFERVSQYKWYADVGQWTTYAKTDQAPGRPRMHVFILQPVKGMTIHHRDSNGLNNCRDNICFSNQSLNTRFGALRKHSSKYRGVYRHRPGKYVAEITINYKKIYIGIYNSEEEAALAYNRRAQELLGANFVPNDVS